MKKIYTLIFGIILSASLFAQAPDAFNYQAVVRDGEGDEIANTTVGLQISILQGSENSSPIYVESFSPETNSLGLISVEVGMGTVVSGDFESINWGDGPYFVKSAVDPAGGNSYTDLGASQLVSVPYALMAAKAEMAVTAESAASAGEAVNAQTAINAQTAANADMAAMANEAVYADTAFYADTADFAVKADHANTAGYAEAAGNVFDGDYNSLNNLPSWNDTIDMRLDSAMFLSGTAESGNLVTYDGMNWIAKDIRLANTGGNQPISIVQPYLAVNYCIALVGIYPSRNWDPFIGTIGIFGFNFAPRGWAQCNGALLPISQNSALFSLVGTYYGGDGRTTFGIPDLRGRVALNQGNGPGLTNYNIGSKGGSENVTISVFQMPSHSHTIIFE